MCDYATASRHREERQSSCEEGTEETAQAVQHAPVGWALTCVRLHVRVHVQSWHLRDQEVAARDHDRLKYRQARGEGRATEEWGAAALEDRMATTDGSQKEKRSRTAERTSRRPRRRNTNLPATLQEKRGNHREKTKEEVKSQEKETNKKEPAPERLLYDTLISPKANKVHLKPTKPYLFESSLNPSGHTMLDA
ncbi:hypothetical protein NDU88_003451 [Pleurodeles waltl]|uniref:Uncharacterized protein n=1 Tax=Pleurodeles waltl TaxID=8319 RepID=A0AAV7UCK2_PLEWA|nr:hypothetical protein NDU88_003451 [Pleurodeles waltl]